jgi:ferredoxin
MPAHRHLRVDAFMCEAHALCVDLAPEVFDLGDDVATCDEEPQADNYPHVEAAIAACPRQAINWVEP